MTLAMSSRRCFIYCRMPSIVAARSITSSEVSAAASACPNCEAGASSDCSDGGGSGTTSGTAGDAAVKLEEKESAYPEISMFGKRFPAYGIYARHVDGMNVRAVKFFLAAPDPREPVVGDDLKDFVNATATEVISK